MKRSVKPNPASKTKAAKKPLPKKVLAPVKPAKLIPKPAGKKKVAVTALKKVTLSLSVPETSAAFVAGDFNDWKPTELKMKKKGKGVFTVQLSLKPGQYEYKFLVDGQWQHDPACLESVANAFGSFNSLLVVE